MTWKIKTFDELTSLEVFRLLQARCEVFIVEQTCPYQDPDDLDLLSVHIFGEENGKIAACCRITPAGTRFPELSIGRLVTTKDFRGQGLGREMMDRAIRYITEEMGGAVIRISGQAYLRKFYESLGFEVTSEKYLEDDIPHYEMCYRK